MFNSLLQTQEVEYGIGVLALLVALWAIRSVNAIIKQLKEVTDAAHKQNERETDLETKLVELTGQALKEATQAREAYEKNTTAINQLSQTLQNFQLGIEGRLLEHTSAILELKQEVGNAMPFAQALSNLELKMDALCNTPIKIINTQGKEIAVVKILRETNGSGETSFSVVVENIEPTAEQPVSVGEQSLP